MKVELGTGWGDTIRLGINKDQVSLCIDNAAVELTTAEAKLLAYAIQQLVNNKENN